MIAITLLGTGSPMPNPDRAGPATLISASDEHYLVDAGRGALMRLAPTGFGAPNLSAVLITHLHSDHILASLEPDVGYRIAHHADLDGPPEINVIEVTEGSVELPGAAGDHVAIRCAQTHHKPVEPSIGFRFDHDGVAVVVAGDTVPCAGLDSLCDGVGTLVLTHYVPPIPTGGNGDDWTALAAEHFSGVVELGDDLHRIEVTGARP